MYINISKRTKLIGFSALGKLHIVPVMVLGNFIFGFGLEWVSSHFDTKPLYDKATEDIKKWENYFFIKIILKIKKHLVT